MPLQFLMGDYFPEFTKLDPTKYVVFDQNPPQRCPFRLDFRPNFFAQIARVEANNPEHDHAAVRLSAQQNFATISVVHMLHLQDFDVYRTTMM